MRKLRYIRLLRSVTLDELALKTGMSASKISRFERGFAKLADKEKSAIAEALEAAESFIFPED